MSTGVDRICSLASVSFGARTKQVEIAGRPKGIGYPGHKEHRPLQNEAVAVGETLSR
jgi:hypothetical protein